MIGNAFYIYECDNIIFKNLHVKDRVCKKANTVYSLKPNSIIYIDTIIDLSWAKVYFYDQELRCGYILYDYKELFQKNKQLRKIQFQPHDFNLHVKLDNVTPYLATNSECAFIRYILQTVPFLPNTIHTELIKYKKLYFFYRTKYESTKEQYNDIRRKYNTFLDDTTYSYNYEKIKNRKASLHKEFYKMMKLFRKVHL